jgi:hypothetical protein
MSSILYNGQSWALTHFFEVRYPLPTQFFPWIADAHAFFFLIINLPFCSSLNQLFAERKRAKSLIPHRIKHKIFSSPLFFYNHLACQDSIPSRD